ncbi:MAG TPA: hypothetical protein VMH00_07830 [Candidatus Limnocylindrales bacterium]|nr:hypothetical protein [Candidatus Limnocylindrales bacterium]
MAKETHWKQGYSAKALADSWYRANGGFPPAVKAVLASVADYEAAELIDGFFEREVELGTAGRNSQTDLMILTRLGNQIGILAVEGKGEESFGPFVDEWKDSSGKQRRLDGLCKTLRLDELKAGSLRYQLLHRTASAIYEAQRYCCRHAMMLVHSFSSKRSGFEDFKAFSQSMGIQVAQPGQCSSSKICENVSVRLAWVADRLA